MYIVIYMYAFSSVPSSFLLQVMVHGKTSELESDVVIYMHKFNYIYMCIYIYAYINFLFS